MALFIAKWVLVPLLVGWIIFAYWKTIKFTYNATIFYKRFMKKDEKGNFEIPTRNVQRRGGRRRDGKKGGGFGNKETGAESAAASDTNFKRID